MNHNAIIEQIRAHLDTDLEKATQGLDIHDLPFEVEQYFHQVNPWVVYKAICKKLERLETLIEIPPETVTLSANGVRNQYGIEVPYVGHVGTGGPWTFELEPELMRAFFRDPRIWELVSDGEARGGEPSITLYNEFGTPVKGLENIRRVINNMGRGF